MSDIQKDVVYRYQAIDEVQRIGRVATLADGDSVVRVSAVEYVLYNIPSAHSDVSDINVGDMVYRQDAIKAFDDAGFCSHGYIVDVLKGLPDVRSRYER